MGDEMNLRGNRIVADAFIGTVEGDVAETTLPVIESTSTSTSVGPGTLTEVIVEILDILETKANI